MTRYAVAVVLSCVASLAQVKPAHPEMLVSTEWLAQHASDKNLVIVDIAPKRDEYDAGHIPGARFLAGDKLYAERNGVKGELLPTEELVRNLEAVGIGNKSRIVIYSSGYITQATRLYWTLDYLGIAKKASLLDGGIEKWTAENRPLSKEPVANIKPGAIKQRVRPELLAKLDDVKRAIDSNSLLIDARPPKRYAEGHIPGATSVFWQQTTVEKPLSEFLDTTKIQAAYDKAGLPHGAKAITYCESGFQATHSYFTLKYLGYKPAMYDGSFMEWNDVRKQPVVTGEQPK